MSTTPAPRDLQLAFDVGHSSLGWAVLHASPGQSPALLGCGAVIFQADDCLASQRRGFRRQRRHIRATRLRIARMKRLLTHLGVLTDDELKANQRAWPWLLAARVLRGVKKLTWSELWDVLRWYAHNRGYDGNKGWSRQDVASDEDTEKEKKAHELLDKFARKYGRAGTMAEVFCDVLKIDPLGAEKSSTERVRNLGAAFPREGVEEEVERILSAHLGVLPQLDEPFIEAVMRDHTAVIGPDYRLPSRYGQRVADGRRTPGGLLFGQLVPRFENRIIASCPITFQHVYAAALDESLNVPQQAQRFERELKRLERTQPKWTDEERWENAAHETAEVAAKVPSAACPEFHRYRWAMQLANVVVQTADPKNPRRLKAAERATVNADMEKRGVLTPTQFKNAVRAITHKAPDNLDRLLALPDAGKSLILDPARDLAQSGLLGVLWPHLGDSLQKHTLTNLRRGHSVTARALLAAAPAAQPAFDHWWDSEAMKKPRKSRKPDAAEPVVRTRDEVLGERHRLDPIRGRAPYSRAVLREAADFVLRTDRHPTEGTEGAADNGPLFRSKDIRHAQLQRSLDEQTNNHLVRHRLKLLERLHADLLKEYAGGEKARIARVTIEVNRDLKEMSGKTAQEQAKEQGAQTKNFRDVATKVRELLGGRESRGFASLVRKARIATDLGCFCPYTGRHYDLLNVINGDLAMDHVIPRSLRESDSLDSLVVTFPRVNEAKDNLTGLQFVKWLNEPGNLEKRDALGVSTVAEYEAFVKSLNTKGHPDDERRKRNRKRLLMLANYVEKEFTPGDLTQTSQLVRLGAEALQRAYLGAEQAPVITSLPGRVTAAVRMSWKLAGCLALANPLVLNPDDRDENGQPRVHRKTELRGITHLHHALDASVLAFTSHFLPRDGGAWKKEVLELLTKRRLAPAEQAILRAHLRDHISFTAEGQPRLRELDGELRKQLRLRLAARRVVMHLPAEWGGLPTKETVWRVFDPADPHPNARRLGHWLAGKNVRIPGPEETTVLLICRKRRGAEDAESGGNFLRETKTWRWVYTEVEKSKVLGLGEHGSKKLREIKGGKLIADNFGLALFPDAPKGQMRFQPIRFFRVWEQLGRLPRSADGRRPPILRRGQLVTFAQGKWAGKIWRILGIEENGRIRFFEPDKVRRIDKPENYQKAQIGSLLRDGLQIVKAPLCGVALNDSHSDPETGRHVDAAPLLG